MKLRLFFVSFLLLFFELSLIRWIPANVRLAGYFSNLVLLGSFFGMGLGLLLTKARMNLLKLFPLTSGILILFVIAFRVEIDIASPNVLFFKPVSQITSVPLVEPEYLLPAIYILVAAVFATLSQELGRLFRHFAPLVSYSIDIAGALFGIIIFSLLSLVQSPSFVWFLISFIVAWRLIYQYKRWLLINSGILVVLMGIIFIRFYLATPDVFWSPYYKVTLQKDADGWGINVNNLGHQFITHWENKEPFYLSPYTLFPNRVYKKILIIGAGAGNDIAIALAKNPNVERIDAVEIDPVIVDIGKRLHPDRPYQDARVHAFVTDGRNFLQNSRDSYDLIIFALTDSLTLTTKTAGIRLESFLFTSEAFEIAKSRLATKGLFVLYNYYRETWLLDKLVGMLTDVFGGQPQVITYGKEGKAGALIAGANIDEIPVNLRPGAYMLTSKIPAAVDDWPFLYVRQRKIPPFYLRIIASLLVSTLLITIPIIKLARERFDLKFFFFGVGFMLLETKRLVTFSLLFGTTWIVNSLVFSAILTSVLVANLISLKVTFRSLTTFYLLLTGILLANYIVPPTVFVHLPKTLRFVITSLFYFSPVFFANIIFSQLFKKTQRPEISFGSNMLGALVGGFLEYSALALGYRILIFFIIAAYLLALVRIPWAKR